MIKEGDLSDVEVIEQRDAADHERLTDARRIPKSAWSVVVMIRTPALRRGEATTTAVRPGIII